jgi:Asp-tRNA(Asn)/Glu-tRNA(Gln) amidotransferase A subunit family amidase
MPISIKGSIALHGTKYTSGFVFQSICEPSTDDAIVVAALVEQGASVYLIKSVPIDI